MFNTRIYFCLHSSWGLLSLATGRWEFVEVIPNKIISAVLYFTCVSWLVYICASECTNRAASIAVSLVSSVTQARLFVHGYVLVNFLSEVIVSTSLACITIPQNKTKTKITWDKKLTTTDIFPLSIFGRQKLKASRWYDMYTDNLEINFFILSCQSCLYIVHTGWATYWPIGATYHNGDHERSLLFSLHILWNRRDLFSGILDSFDG